MVAELIETGSVLSEYGLMVAEVILLTVISFLAFVIRNSFNSHN